MDTFTETYKVPLAYRTDRRGRILYRLSLAREALRGRCRDEQDWVHGFHVPYWVPLVDQCGYDRHVLPRTWRWAHTAKAVVCVLFLRYRPFKHNDDCIEVAWFDAENDYTYEGLMGSWTTLVIGKGWRGWRWMSYRDGT